jgi:hypothetical protein
LEWIEADPFWGLQTPCGTFSIREQTVGGKREYVLWRMGEDGKVIPKWRGVFETFEEAAAKADEERFEGAPKRNKIFDWRSDADEW